MLLSFTPLLLLAASSAGAAPAQVQLAGGDDVAWMIVHGPESAEPNASHAIALWSARPRLDGLEVTQVIWKQMPALTGKLRMHSAGRDALYIGFVNGDFAVMAANGLCTPLERPSRSLTVKGIAADSAGNYLFALARTGDGKTREWTLHRHAGDGWSRIAILADAPGEQDEIWMTARRGHVAILWSARAPAFGAAPATAPERRPLNCIEWVDSEWTSVRELPLHGSHGDVWLGWDNEIPLALAAEWSAGPDLMQTLHFLRREGGAWRSAGYVSEKRDAGGEAQSPISFRWDELEATVAGNRLMLVRADPNGRNLIGWGTLTEPPLVTWDVSGLIGSPLAAQRVPSWANMVAVGAMIVLLLFLRPDREAMFAELPAHLKAALPFHRALAVMVDLIPCMVLTVLWWIKPIGTMIQQSPQWERLAPEELQRVADALLGGPWLIVICSYAVYCFVWELFTGTTPGKHLLRCRVVNARAERPSPRQVFIRGIIRVPELLSLWITLSTLFVMLVLSPRRQRIGDVLAGTLVVQTVVPVATAVAVSPPANSGEPDSGPPPTDTPGGASS